MINALRAETLKLRRHRATWLMVWIYPLALLLLTLFALIRGIVVPDAAVEQAASAAQWIEKSAMMWSVPQSGLGRYLMAGFCAVVFAGEYGWNTWKLVIPARARWQLIMAKWVVVAAFLYASFMIADLVVLSGEWLRGAIGQTRIPTGVSAGAVAHAHIMGMVQAAVPIAYTVVAAGLLGIATRSVLATVILSIVLITIEQLLPGIAVVLGGYASSLTRFAVEVLPFYHVANLLNWFKSGDTLKLLIGSAPAFSTGWQLSLAAALVWIAGAAALTVRIFGRQDQN